MIEQINNTSTDTMQQSHIEQFLAVSRRYLGH